MRHLRGDSGFDRAGYRNPLRVYVGRVQLFVIEDERSGFLAQAQPDGAVLTTRIRRGVNDIGCKGHALAVEIERYIERKGLTQAKAAAAFGVPQPTISKIVRGDLSRLSVEYLLKMLARVGVTVQLVAGTRKQVKRSVAA